MNTALPQATRRQKLFADFMKADDDLSHEMYQDKKQGLFQPVKGKVLEIGPGTGVNFKFLAKDCIWTGIEPNPAMHPHLTQAASQHWHNSDALALVENIEQVPSLSQDFVISTLVMCSVPSVERYVHQIKRVLKPGGQYLFIEHVADKPRSVRRAIQKTAPFTPWRYFSDGCHPGRDIGPMIEHAGFSQVKITSYMQQGSGIILAINRPHIVGVAIK